MSVSASLKRFDGHCTGAKDLFDVVRTALPLQKSYLQQRAPAHSRDWEKLLADMTVAQSEFGTLRADMQARFDLIQNSLDGDMKHANSVNCERVMLLVSTESLMLQLPLGTEKSQEIDDLKYRLDSATAKERRS